VLGTWEEVKGYINGVRGNQFYLEGFSLQSDVMNTWLWQLWGRCNVFSTYDWTKRSTSIAKI